MTAHNARLIQLPGMTDFLVKLNVWHRSVQDVKGLIGTLYAKYPSLSTAFVISGNSVALQTGQPLKSQKGSSAPAKRRSRKRRTSEGEAHSLQEVPGPGVPIPSHEEAPEKCAGAASLGIHSTGNLQVLPPRSFDQLRIVGASKFWGLQWECFN